MGNERSSKEDKEVVDKATETTAADKDIEKLAAQSPQIVEDTRADIHDSFNWLFNDAKLSLESLGAQLEAKDDPPWYERFAEIALDVALTAGGAAAGELIANQLIGEEGKSVIHEFTKAAFEEGIGSAVAAGRAKFIGTSSVHRFVQGQTAALLSATHSRQSAWNMRGRHLIQTESQAKAARDFLLQRMESFTGVSILTTNHDASIDDAFRRRLALHVRFPMPDESLRAQLWRALLPADAPVTGRIDHGALGELELTGGYIKNAVLRAAYLAADEGGAIAMRHLLRAARAECEAIGMLVG